MAVTAERFAQGLTYAQYKEQMTRNQERFIANEAKVVLKPEDRDFFRNLPTPLNLLVIAEDWCGDVISGLPVVGKLLEEGARLTVRVFLRDQNLDITDQYLKEGKFRSIPVFVFFDEQMGQRGYFIERPDSVTQELARRRRAIFAEHPEFGSPDTPADQLPEAVRLSVQQATTAIRTELAPWMNDELVRSLRATLA
jgi:hypothetical protein